MVRRKNLKNSFLNNLMKRTIARNLVKKISKILCLHLTSEKEVTTRCRANLADSMGFSESMHLFNLEKTTNDHPNKTTFPMPLAFP
jgi:hypothetical protein